ncbi:FHA domain-containing protein [Agreia sp.]|uniref:FHA domain-containing protein n=1 Tax=Agreia sp. TaxID=1872416 RepID=UPI0035BC4934
MLAASALSDTQHVTPLPGPGLGAVSGRREAAAPPARTAASTAEARASFRLVFSTGESVVIRGPGLIGRNPVPALNEPQLEIVRIVDPQLSVSKTHLEFGIEDGLFWISDRNSGNGTSIFASNDEPVDALPGERYGVARGTRIRIGEQHFDIF